MKRPRRSYFRSPSTSSRHEAENALELPLRRQQAFWPSAVTTRPMGEEPIPICSVPTRGRCRIEATVDATFQNRPSRPSTYAEVAQRKDEILAEVADEQEPRRELHREEKNRHCYLSSCSGAELHSVPRPVFFLLRAAFLCFQYPPASKCRVPFCSSLLYSH